MVHGLKALVEIANGNKINEISRRKIGAFRMLLDGFFMKNTTRTKYVRALRPLGQTNKARTCFVQVKIFIKNRLKASEMHPKLIFV